MAKQPYEASFQDGDRWEIPNLGVLTCKRVYQVAGWYYPDVNYAATWRPNLPSDAYTQADQLVRFLREHNARFKDNVYDQ